jgi:alpha-1,2-glucosyltransferase
MENKKKLIILFASLFLVLLACWLMTTQNGPQADETAHATQISYYIKGEYVKLNSLTVPPTYHLIVAMICKSIGVTSLPSIRLVNMILLFILFIPIVYILTKNYYKTLQSFFFPTLFLYFVLIYTDIFSTILILISFYLMTKERYIWSAVVGTLALFVRQNNIVWFAFIITYDYFKDDGEEDTWNWKKLIPYICGGLLFVAFIYFSGGVVQGDSSHHPITIHFGNIWMFLFTFFLCFLPYSLSVLPKLKNKIKESWENNYCIFISIVLTLITIGVMLFRNTHEYNQIKTAWFNELLIAIDNHMFIRLIYLAIIILSVLVLWVTEFDSWHHYLLYFFTPIYLMLSWMIEVRYYFIPMLLFIIFMKYDNPKIERMATVYNILIALLWFMTLIISPF